MQRGSGHGGANGADVKAQWTCERAARGIISQECARAKQSQRMLAPEIKRYLTVGAPEDFAVGSKNAEPRCCKKRSRMPTD